MAHPTHTPSAAPSPTVEEAATSPLDLAAEDVDAEERASEALLALLTDDSDDSDGSDEPAPPILVPERIFGVVVGTLLRLGPTGATVAWLGAPAGVPARVAAALGPEHVGRGVALVFEQGDPSRPIVLGVMERFVPAAAEPRDVTSGEVAQAGAPSTAAEPGLRVEALADGERVVLEANHELVLSCGKASITLTRAGKVLIRGSYVSSHATGTQRIRGGTVEIN